MPIFSVNNTVTKLTAPAANDIEVSFGLAALKLLEKGDQAGLKKLMKIRDKVKAASAELDDLVDQSAGD
jgi:hypothetical protein